MSIPGEHARRYFFHFTHIDNLQSIVEHGLISTNLKNKSRIEHVNVASESIQERRSTMVVPCGNKGVVHDYVPFYFCSVNPMFLSMLYSKNVDQPLIVILAIPIKRIEQPDAIFTDASANTKTLPNFYENPDDLSKLNWQAIDSIKWKAPTDDERHAKMAEVLIYERVSISDVESIIVWNDDIKKKVTEIFKERNVSVPELAFSPFKIKYKFHFTKFMFKGRENESLVTGPKMLRQELKETIRDIKARRAEATSSTSYPFKNIADFLKKLESNFSLIPELAGIYKLETINDVHTEDVSDHTLMVIDEVKKSKYYTDASKIDKEILVLSAYLHDIGKGPASKWLNGKQPVYPDHPVDSLSMLNRILVEDIGELSDYEIKMICMLVAYHDLIGEIFGKGRNEEQLFDLIKNEKEFDMLTTLNFADVSAISFMWKWNYRLKIKRLKTDVLNKIGEL